ncbi:MAG: amidohydrolase family protein [Bacteroidota bacterium]
MNPKIHHISIVRYILLVIAFTSLTSSIDAQIPAPPAETPRVIQASYIHTLTHGTIENGMVLIENGLITAVGTDVEIPPDAIIDNYDGKHVYPAFIHARNLLGLSEIGAVPVTSDFNELGTINPNVRAQVAFHPGSRHIGVAATHGIAISASTPTGGFISGLSAAMYTDGWSWDQRIMQAPAGLIVNWPVAINNKEYKKQVGELREAFDQARRYHLAANTQTDHPSDVRWEAMLGVFDGQLPVFIHANEISQIQDAVAWALQENLQIVITGGRDAALMAGQLASHNIPVLLTPVIGGPARQWDHYGEAYARAALLHNEGVTFAIAGDFGASSIYRLPHHAGAAVAFGLPHEEALKAITLYPAQILGLEQRAGSIEEGKEAHLIITNGDPLDFFSSLEQVYILGKKIDMQNHHTIMMEKYMEKNRQQNQPSP